MSDADAQAYKIRGEGEAQMMKSLEVLQQNPEPGNFQHANDGVGRVAQEADHLDPGSKHLAAELAATDPAAASSNPTNRRTRRPHERPEPIPPPPPAEDAGSQALAEALRSSFFIVKIIMVVLVLAVPGSGFFTVGPQQKAIVLRLGKPVGEGEQRIAATRASIGLFRRPIDEVECIPFTSLQTADSSVGWYHYARGTRQGCAAAARHADRSTRPRSAYALTADTNIIHVVATARYRITDPIRFHFDFTNAPVFMTNASQQRLVLRLQPDAGG